MSERSLVEAAHGIDMSDCKVIVWQASYGTFYLKENRALAVFE